jgi:hypothetical protein
VVLRDLQELGPLALALHSAGDSEHFAAAQEALLPDLDTNPLTRRPGSCSMSRTIIPSMPCIRPPWSGADARVGQNKRRC